MSSYEGLTPAQKLELMRREERQEQKALNEQANRAIRDAWRQAKGIRPTRPRSKLLDTELVEGAWRQLRDEGMRGTQEQVVERLSGVSPDLESVTVKTLQRRLAEWGLKWPPPWRP